MTEVDYESHWEAAYATTNTLANLVESCSQSKKPEIAVATTIRFIEKNYSQLAFAMKDDELHSVLVQTIAILLQVSANNSLPIEPIQKLLTESVSELIASNLYQDEKLTQAKVRALGHLLDSSITETDKKKSVTALRLMHAALH